MQSLLIRVLQHVIINHGKGCIKLPKGVRGHATFPVGVYSKIIDIQQKAFLQQDDNIGST